MSVGSTRTHTHEHTGYRAYASRPWQLMLPHGTCELSLTPGLVRTTLLCLAQFTYKACNSVAGHKTLLGAKASCTHTHTHTHTHASTARLCADASRAWRASSHHATKQGFRSIRCARLTSLCVPTPCAMGLALVVRWAHLLGQHAHTHKPLASECGGLAYMAYTLSSCYESQIPFPTTCLYHKPTCSHSMRSYVACVQVWKCLLG